MAKRQSTAGNLSKKTIRVPLVGNNLQRETSSDKDQRFINYCFETTKNTVTDTKKLYMVKRPGSVLHSTPSATAAAGRGAWYFNGAVWSVFGATLYKGTTSKQTLSTASGMCGAVEFVNNDDFGKAGLFIADGVDGWIIDSSDTVTQVDTRHLQWSGATTVEEGDRRVPTTLGSLWYVCTTSGQTGLTEPTWPTVIGNSVNDGTTTWRCEGTYSGPSKYTTGAKTVGTEVIPTTESGYWYECTTAGDAAAEPAEWPLIVGDTIVDGTVTWTCAGQYGGFPSPHVATPTFMDGYLFLPDYNSLDIYGTDVSAPFSWGALNFASAESYPDPLIALARQNNYVVALGSESVEFMYNYAKVNALTDYESPLDRYESLVLQTGCLHKNAILQSERILIFIGQSKMGGKSIWRLDGSNAKEISTEYVEKFLDLETADSAVSGFGCRIFGHILFVLNLPTADKTFVYDLEENMWTEWQYNGGMLPFVTFCDANGVVVVQHATDGKLYKLDPLVYNDFDASIASKVRLAKQDFDTDAYKFYHQTTLIGDKSTGSYTLRWSDDDYETWSNTKTLAAGSRPYFLRSGSARRRAWEIGYTDNSASRLEALEVTYSIGDH